MSPYVRTTWVDEALYGPPRFKISTDLGDGDIATNAKIELITLGVRGTPFDATHLNNLEDGVESAISASNSAVSTASSALATAQVANGNATSALATVNSKIPLSTVTAAGDLIVASGNAEVQKLIKGAEGQRLTMRNGAVAWMDPVGVSIFKTAQTIANNTVTLLTLDSATTYDNMGFAGSGKITIPSGYPSGPYRVSITGYYDGVVSGLMQLGVKKTHGASEYMFWHSAGAVNSEATWLNLSMMLQLVPGDIVQGVALQKSGGSVIINTVYLDLYY